MVLASRLHSVKPVKLVNMRQLEKQLLDKRLKDFQKEVIPDVLFPYLPCLIPEDKEEIQAKQNNHGLIKATALLVDRLKRRGDKAFPQFVQALRKCGGEHTALLLDPYYLVKDDVGDDEIADLDESGLGFRMIGTAIDVRISGNLLPEGSEDPTENCCEFEKILAERYRDQKSEENKEMRRELQKHLPQGAVFVNTENGSIISTFRLSSEDAANKIWEMYTKGTFQSMLQTVLVENALKDEVQERPLKLNLSLGLERFKTIKEKLAEIKAKQERESRESLLDFSSEQENGRPDEDGCEIEFDIPPVFLGLKGNSLGVSKLELREYQKELAAPAIQGKNTIICAPTNSGKTYVAIEIAKRHLESFSKDADQSPLSASNKTSKEPKVVFIVSTVSLVLQQKERFEAFLGDKYSVGEISGANATDIPLKYLLQSHQIVVMTAQILVNALNSTNKEERVAMGDISLLLFDECHHAHKEHPYNSIMEKYLSLKFQPGSQHCLPQIIGLTASLGTGKAKDVGKAEEHIILVSANLDAEVISTVQKNIAELKTYANVLDQNLFHAQKNEHDPFERIISKVMKHIELMIKQIKGKLYKEGPPDKAGQQYRQWVEEFYKDCVAEGNRYLVTYTEHLREYHVALTLNTSTRMKNARQYLKKYFDSLDREKFTGIDEKFKNLYQKAMQALDKDIQLNGLPDNPLLKKLKELLLLNYIDAENQESKENQSNKVTNGGGNEGGGEGEEPQDSASARTPEKVDDKRNAKSESVANSSERADDLKQTSENKWEEGEKEEDYLGNGKERKIAKESPSEDGLHDEDLVGGAVKRNNSRSQGAESTNEVETFGSSDDPETKKNDSEEIDNHEENKASKSAGTTAKDKPSNEKSAQQKEWEGPKGILFTRTRESTEALLDWIKETKELNDVLRPEKLVGGGDGNIGMTKNEQEKVIKRFKTGEKNLLLATSVAEEGLDINDCNFVIRYDMMGNEISAVQSRGRVRADKGKYSVLVAQSGALKRERTSRFREILMTEALNKVQRMDPEKFHRTVREVQRKSYQDRYLKKHMFAIEKSVTLPNDVKFLCRKCNQEACRANDVRRIKGSYYVIINSDVRDSKVDIRKHPKPKIIDDVEINKKIFCKQCHEDWGVITFINRVEWICIKIASFVLEFPEQGHPRKMYKKWKDLPFGIKEADLDELLQYNADKSESTDLLDIDQLEF